MGRVVFIVLLMILCKTEKHNEIHYPVLPGEANDCHVKEEGWEYQMNKELPSFISDGEGLWTGMFNKKGDVEGIRITDGFQKVWDGKIVFEHENIKTRKIKPIIKTSDIIMKINDCDFDTMFLEHNKAWDAWAYHNAGYMPLFYVLLFYDESEAKKYIKTVTVRRNGKIIVLKVK